MMITNLFVCSKSFPHFLFSWIYNREVLKRVVSKMKKFLHFGIVIVIVVLFFLCEVRWKRKGTFSKVLLFLFEYITLQSTKPQNWKKKQKKKCWSKFRKKRQLLAEWLNNAWLMHYWVFLANFYPFFCLSFIHLIFGFWWLLCYILEG